MKQMLGFALKRVQLAGMLRRSVLELLGCATVVDAQLHWKCLNMAAVEYGCNVDSVYAIKF